MGAPVAAKDKKRGGGGQKGGRGGKRGRGGAPFRGGMMRGGGRGGMRGGMLPPMMPPMRGGRGPMRGRMRGGMPPPMMMGPPMHPMYPHPGMMPPPHMMYGPPMPPPMHFRGGPRGKGGRFQQNFRGGVNAKGKIVKKRNGKANHKKPMDVTKPFVTDEIKAEFTLKDELLTKAKASQDKDDWVKFREQRDKCSTIYLAAEKEFKGQQEGDTTDEDGICAGCAECEDYEFEEESAENYEECPENYEEYTEAYEEYAESCEEYAENNAYSYTEENYNEHNAENPSFSCETCDRDFYNKQYYDKHMSEHRVCNIDGCQFTAHAKIVDKHIEMQHCTGLYDKIRNINTPEDIAKWREERKKKYPNKENILKRYEQQEEKLKRGATIKKKDNKFGKDKFRYSKLYDESFQKLYPFFFR